MPRNGLKWRLQHASHFTRLKGFSFLEIPFAPSTPYEYSLAQRDGRAKKQLKSMRFANFQVGLRQRIHEKKPPFEPSDNLDDGCWKIRWTTPIFANLMLNLRENPYSFAKEGLTKEFARWNLSPPRDRGPGDQDDDCRCQPVSASRNR